MRRVSLCLLAVLLILSGCANDVELVSVSTLAPTLQPTAAETATPSPSPTAKQTITPTQTPTPTPTIEPTQKPTPTVLTSGSSSGEFWRMSFLMMSHIHGKMSRLP